MSPKKQYQKKLPATLPPKPRQEPELEQVREAIRKLASDLDHELGPAGGGTPVAPAARPATPPRPAARPVPRPVPPPVPPPVPRPVTDGPDERRRPTRAIALLALAVLVAAGVGGGLVAWWLGRDDTADPPASPPATVAPGWPPEGASRTVTRVLPDGTLHVTQWIHTPDPIDELELTLPDSTDAARVQATGVEIEADGRPGTGPGDVTFTQSSYVFEAATRIRVRYRLSGVVERSGSAAGRALATTTALQVSAAQPRDVRVIRSGAVLSLACARSSAVEPTPCGESYGAGEWRVTLDGADTDARVLAAVTLPS